MYIYMHIRVCVHVFVDRESCASGNVCFINSIAASVANSLSLSLFCIFYHHRFRFFSRRLRQIFLPKTSKVREQIALVRLSFFRERQIDRSKTTRERERISRARARKKKDVGLGQRGNREDKVVGRRRRRFFASRFSRARGPAAKRKCRCFGTTNRKDEDDDGREQVPVAERSGEARRREEEERHETFAGGVFWNGDGVGANRRRWGVQTFPRRRKRIRPGGRVRAADGAEPRTARGRRNG